MKLSDLPKVKFFCRFGKSEVALRTVRIGDKKLTDIKWFKFDPHTFDTAQMRYLGGAHERGALYQLVWVKLLCEAAKCGDGGRIYIFKGRVITTRELSVIFGMDEDTVAMAVCLLTDMGLLKYDGESGLVVRDFSDYLGEGYLGAVREEEPVEDRLDTEDEEAELSEEEIKRERNREAQRRWRERNKQKKAANKENSVILHGGNSNNSVTQSEKNRNESVIISNSERNCTVIERNTERNESNTDSVISPPKNIFIEENRIEESRIEDKRKEEIRKEENENNFLSPAPPRGACAKTREMKNTENVNNCYGIFNNVYLSADEYERLRAEFGDILPELIEDLSCAMESEGRSYNNHFATLLRWGKNKYAPKRRLAPSGEYRKGEQASYGGAGGNGGNGGYYSRGGENAGGNYGQDSGAQKKNSYRSGYEPIRNLTREEAEEAFRRALERTAAGG